jgi:hypothetical protein
MEFQHRITTEKSFMNISFKPNSEVDKVELTEILGLTHICFYFLYHLKKSFFQLRGCNSI